MSNDTFAKLIECKEVLDHVHDYEVLCELLPEVRNYKETSEAYAIGFVRGIIDTIIDNA